MRSKQQTSLEQLPLEDSWKALRGKPLRRKVVEKIQPPPPVESVIKWTLRFHEEDRRGSMLVVPGTTAHDRLDFYQKYLSEEWDSFRPGAVEDIVGPQARDWVEQTILSNFTDRIARMTVPKSIRQDLLGDFQPPTASWEVIWALGFTDGLVVNGSLREMVDQPHYLFHDIYRVLWSLRFRLRETGSAATVSFFNTVVRWLTGNPLSMAEAHELEAAGATRRITTDRERFDVLLFLITLAEQNGLLNRYVICFDGLERVLTSDSRSLLREMQTFLTTVDRWVRFAQTPIGVLIGMDTNSRHMSLLQRLNKKLANDIEAGVAWAPKPR